MLSDLQRPQKSTNKCCLDVAEFLRSLYESGEVFQRAQLNE